MGKRINLVNGENIKLDYGRNCEICSEKIEEWHFSASLICETCFDTLKKIIMEKRNETPKVQINREELYKLYMEWVNKVADDCDWKTSFEPEEIVHSIASILENNPNLIK